MEAFKQSIKEVLADLYRAMTYLPIILMTLAPPIVILVATVLIFVNVSFIVGILFFIIIFFIYTVYLNMQSKK